MFPGPAIIVRRQIREQTTETDDDTIPEPRPRIISDNGPRFVVENFEAFVRLRQNPPLLTGGWALS